MGSLRKLERKWEYMNWGINRGMKFGGGRSREDGVEEGLLMRGGLFWVMKRAGRSIRNRPAMY